MKFCMKASKIKDVQVGSMDSYFFDTNVWMFLFAPLAGSKANKQGAYSKLLGEIISRRATIWINSLVVAEYVNAVLRLEFKQWMRRERLSNADFKHDFRPTGVYQTALAEVKNQVQDILGIATRRSDDFHMVDVDALIASMGTSLDYGDSVIVDACKRANLKLVTDDTDITKLDLPFVVLTA